MVAATGPCCIQHDKVKVPKDQMREAQLVSMFERVGRSEGKQQQQMPHQQTWAFRS